MVKSKPVEPYQQKEAIKFCCFKFLKENARGNHKGNIKVITQTMSHAFNTQGEIAGYNTCG